MVARITAQWLTQRLGQAFVVENRPGAGGNVGTESVVRAAPDGYTLLVCGPVNTINTSLYEKLNFNFSTDIAPIAGIVRVPLVMVVGPSITARTVKEFITYAKAHPGKINVASGGNGTPQHVAAELFKMMAGVDMVHVPYRGTALALNDLFGGQVQVMFEAMPAVIGHINSGKLHALAVTTSVPSPVLPALSTVAEFVPGYEAYSWYGLAAPSHTPPEIIALLNKQINAALGDDKFKARLEALGGTILGGSAEDLGRLVAVETNKWRKVVQGAHIKVD
jgi:tripartite-type tricarboxylate transporter receptor subunit TctC